MASRSITKRHVDPDIFKDYIKSRGVSIRQLGSLCETNERTIRRMLQDREVTLNVALDLAIFFDCNFDALFGLDDNRRWKDSVATIMQKVC